MRISIGQIIALTLIVFLLFGDLKNARKRLADFLKQTKNLLKKKNRKKRI